MVDPVLDNNKIYQDFISQHSLRLSFILETHTHADHVTGSGTLHDIYGCKIYCGLSSNSKNIETVSDGQEILLDNLFIKALYTPGHTDDSFSYLLKYYQDCYLFTGDTLLINGCGRTANKSLVSRVIASICRSNLTKRSDDEIDICSNSSNECT